MTYSCVHGTSPAYFHGICCPVASIKGCAILRSANFGELVEPAEREENATVHASSVSLHCLFGTIYHDIYATMTLVVNNSLAI